MFPEAVADPPRRGEDDDDPVEELSDPVPALQALRRRMLAANAGKDPPPTTGTDKSRRKRALPESTSEDYDSVYLVGGSEGRLSSTAGRSSPSHSKLRTAESKAVAAVESAEKSAGAKREANTGTTAALQGRLTKAQLALRKATESVETIEKELGEQRKQPEKIDSDLATAKTKACTKLYQAVERADRGFMRPAYQFFYGHKMVTNGGREGLIHRLSEGDDPVITPEAAKLVR